MRSLVNMISAGHLPTDPVVIRIPYIGHLLLHCNIFLQRTIKFPLRLREFFWPGAGMAGNKRVNTYHLDEPRRKGRGQNQLRHDHI